MRPLSVPIYYKYGVKGKIQKATCLTELMNSTKIGFSNISNRLGSTPIAITTKGYILSKDKELLESKTSLTTQELLRYGTILFTDTNFSIMIEASRIEALMKNPYWRSDYPSAATIRSSLREVGSCVRPNMYVRATYANVIYTISPYKQEIPKLESPIRVFDILTGKEESYDTVTEASKASGIHRLTLTRLLSRSSLNACKPHHRVTTDPSAVFSRRMSRKEIILCGGIRVMDKDGITLVEENTLDGYDKLVQLHGVDTYTNIKRNFITHCRRVKKKGYSVELYIKDIIFQFPFTDYTNPLID